MAPLGGVRFDWILVVLGSAVVLGAYLDAWAHNHVIESLETFFTPWHALLYAGYFGVEIFLVGTLVYNRRRGYPWSRALPEGYGGALAGVAIFMAGGVADAVWHTLFGFEQNFAVVMSPPHLALVFGSILIASAPIRAAWGRTEPEQNRGWAALMPMVLSALFVLSAITLMTGYANPFQNPWPLRGFRAGIANNTEIANVAPYTVVADEAGQALGVLAIIAHTAIVMGLVLILVRRWTLPPGSLTLIFVVNAGLCAVREFPTQYWVAFPMGAGGVVADVLLGWLRPSLTRVGALRVFAFAVPTILYVIYFAVLHLIRGVEWPPAVWSGSIVIAGVVGWGVSYVLVPPEGRGTTTP